MKRIVIVVGIAIVVVVGDVVVVDHDLQDWAGTRGESIWEFEGFFVDS